MVERCEGTTSPQHLALQRLQSPRGSVTPVRIYRLRSGFGRILIWRWPLPHRWKAWRSVLAAAVATAWHGPAARYSAIGGSRPRGSFWLGLSGGWRWWPRLAVPRWSGCGPPLDRVGARDAYLGQRLAEGRFLAIRLTAGDEPGRESPPRWLEGGHDGGGPPRSAWEYVFIERGKAMVGGPTVPCPGCWPTPR